MGAAPNPSALLCASQRREMCWINLLRLLLELKKTQKSKTPPLFLSAAVMQQHEQCFGDYNSACKIYQEKKEVEIRWFLTGVNVLCIFKFFIEALGLPCSSPAIPGWASFLSSRCPSSQTVWLLCDMDICGLGTKLRTLNSISLR